MKPLRGVGLGDKGHPFKPPVGSGEEKQGARDFYQLFEGHEYAKLGLDEKDFSQAWDFWNHSSHLL
jgi:hypothetical protein